MGVVDLVRVMRPYQWYKNIVVFLALVFSGSMFDTGALLLSFLAFISFCLLSSASYVLNDLADKERDRLNPEKAMRPLASGAVGEKFALFLVIMLSALGFGVAVLLPVSFVYTVLAYFALAQIYTIWLKNEAFADILAISGLFVLRAVGGALAIGVYVSPWLVANVFFLALFLTLGKRRGELFAGASAHRPVLAYYDSPLTAKLGSTVTSALIISYTLFVFFGDHSGLFITLPVVLYAVFRYEHFIENGSAVARHPHKVFADYKILFSMALWSVMVLMVLY